MWTGEPTEFRFDGVIRPEAAYQIGRFATMAYFLEERANSAWVQFKPIKVDFLIHQDSEVGLFWVYVELKNATRSTKRQIDKFSYREDAEAFVEVARKLMTENPL